MKQIVIFRHGKVDIKDNKKIFAYEFKEWIERYNRCDIILDKQTQEKKKIVDKVDFIVCSHLKRSIQSAEFLEKKPSSVDAMFNEAELPCAQWPILKFSPMIWSVIFRTLWFFGYSKNCESYKEAKLRAKKASLELVKLSKKHDKIIIFGHGIFNGLLLKEMILNGWKISKKLESKNWGYGIIEKN